MSNESAPIPDAPAPFSGVSDPDSNSRPSDFILRSSDGVDFHVHRDILKFSSDFFDDMFAIPGPGDGDPNGLRRDGKPVLLMSEPQVVLLQLLRLAYPADTVDHFTLKQEDLDAFLEVYNAAQKYQFLRVQRVLKKMLDNSALIDAQPHRIFAIARLCDFLELSRKAALSTLNSPLSEVAPGFPEMKLLSWQDAHPLYQFHQMCGQKAVEIVEKSILRVSFGDSQSSLVAVWMIHADTRKLFIWWQYSGHSPQCKDSDAPYSYNGNASHSHGPDGKVLRSPIAWCTDHCARLAAELRLRPSRATVETEAHSLSSAHRLIVEACPVCSKSADADLANFTRQLADKIDLSNKQLGKPFHEVHYHRSLMNLLHLSKPTKPSNDSWLQDSFDSGSR